MAHVKTMGPAKTMEDVDITATNPVTAVKEDADHKTMEIGVEAVVVEPTVILHIAVGHTEFVPIWAKTEGPQKMATKRTQYGASRCRAGRETEPDRLGGYVLIKLM